MGFGPVFFLFVSMNSRFVCSQTTMSFMEKNIFEEDCRILHQDLDNLAQSEADWPMKFNVAKYHSMRVPRQLPPNTLNMIKYCISKCGTGSVCQNLGITISDNLN